MATLRSHSLRAQLALGFLFALSAFGHQVDLSGQKLFQLTKFQQFSFDSLKGKPYVMVVFQTDCAPCREQLKALKCAREMVANAEVVAVGLGEAQALAKEVRPLALGFPTLEGTSKFTEAIDGVTSTPTTFFMDKNGKLIKRETGTRTCEAWKILLAR